VHQEFKLYSLDYWRLCDELSVLHAALLIVGKDPSEISVYVEKWAVHERPVGYEAAKTALKNAVRSGRLKAIIAMKHGQEDGTRKPRKENGMTI
jgi:hypothetical protein